MICSRQHEIEASPFAAKEDIVSAPLKSLDRPCSAPQSADISRLGGFTLIEVMIVVAIISIIAVFAVPSYQNFVAKTLRSQAKSVLTQVATRQEQFFLDNKSFAASMADLGYRNDKFFIDSDGREVGVADAIYEISLTAMTATSYTIAATPVSHQASRDAACGTLTMTNTGQRAQSGDSTDCW